MWGGELVLRDDVPVGQVTSGAWGEALRAHAGLAYIRNPSGAAVTADFARSGCYEVNVGGRVFPAAVHLRPPFDPQFDRVKGRYYGG
jgi:glycine cleavage system aminomethyltransferase T